jgi:uncharacterized repeat protein (TIGR03803 family)
VRDKSYSLRYRMAAICSGRTAITFRVTHELTWKVHAMKIFPLLAAISALTLTIVVPPAQARNFLPLHQFNTATDGARPQGALLRDSAGNLYGTTNTGGGAGEGAVFKIDTQGNETILFSFSALKPEPFPLRRWFRIRRGISMASQMKGQAVQALSTNSRLTASKHCCTHSRGASI